MKRTTPTNLLGFLQQQKERKSSFATYLHHLFILHALQLDRYGFWKNDINKNKIQNYAELSLPFQYVFKKNRTENDLVCLEIKTGTAQNQNPPKNRVTDNCYPA